MNATPPLLVSTPLDLREALAARGITQQGFARLTGRNPRTIRRWCDERRLAPFDIFTRTFITVALDKFDKTTGTLDPAASIGADASSNPTASPHL
jgi:hypothetical protein